MNVLQRCFFLGLALIVSHSAKAITSSHHYFSSELQAVQAATTLYNPISMREDREFMGTIYRRGNFFGYTVAAGEAGADRIQIGIPAGEWDSVVALWHTHGDASPMHQYFSQLDTQLVKRFGKPLYLADFTGNLKVFGPEDRMLTRAAARRLGLPARRGYAKGRQVRSPVDNRLIEIAVAR